MRTRLTLLLITLSGAAPAREPGYLDPASCIPCHQKAAEGYSKSAMARSFGVASSVPEGTFHHDKTQQDFTVAITGGKTYLTRTVTGLPGTYTAEIRYRIGSGEHAASFLSRGAQGRLLELPLTWYAADGGRWAMSPGYDLPFHAGFTRRITYGCLFCHAGYPDLPRDAVQEPAGWKLPAKLPEGIDCQRCHGPGEAHVASARAGQSPQQIRSAIVNPKKLDSARGMEVCLQCHLETTAVRLPPSIVRYDRPVFSYRAGEPLADYILHFDEAPGPAQQRPLELVSEAYRMRLSACFRQSQGALTCMTCHNPHDIPRAAAATRHYNAVCQTCHSATAAPHFTSGDCVTCHMPKQRPADALNTLVSDHWIRKRPSAAPNAEPIERNDSTVPAWRGEVLLYYPPALSQSINNELYLADAQLKNRANTQSGIARMEALLRQTSSIEPAFYLDLAEAAGSAEYARRAAELMPSNWRAWLTLGNLTGSTEALQKAVALAPDESTAWQSLGEAWAKQGKFSESLAAFRSAIAADPKFAEGHNNAGATLLRRGDTAGAEKELREAVRLRPESSAMQVNLASLLARGNQIPEARRRFELALKLNPAYAEGHAAYGAALGRMQEWEAAQDHLTQAVRLNPRLPIARHNLGVALLRAGDSDGALAQFEKAVELDPDYYDAQLELGLLLKRKGQAAGAAAHLTKALESPAPRVRQAAAQALNN